MADPGGPAVQGVVMRPLACWDCGFEFRKWQGCLSVVSVVCCHAQVSASGILT
jgi:predicted Zn-ribbon and HTH transcriptional regulator